MTKTRWDCHGLVDVSAYEISWNCWNRLWKVFSETHQNAACSSQPLSSSKLHLRQKARPNAVDLEDLGVDIEIKRNFVAWNLCSSEKTLWPGLAPPQHNMLEKKYSTIGCSFCKSHTHTQVFQVLICSAQRKSHLSEHSYLWSTEIWKGHRNDFLNTSQLQ